MFVDLFKHSNESIAITGAATRGVLWKKVFLEISQNSQENTYAKVSFLMKLQILAQVFSCEFCEISKNISFYRARLGDCFCDYSCNMEIFCFYWMYRIKHGLHLTRNKFDMHAGSNKTYLENAGFCAIYMGML